MDLYTPGRLLSWRAEGQGRTAFVVPGQQENIFAGRSGPPSLTRAAQSTQGWRVNPQPLRHTLVRHQQRSSTRKGSGRRREWVENRVPCSCKPLHRRQKFLNRHAVVNKISREIKPVPECFSAYGGGTRLVKAPQFSPLSPPSPVADGGWNAPVTDDGQNLSLRRTTDCPTGAGKPQ